MTGMHGSQDTSHPGVPRRSYEGVGDEAQVPRRELAMEAPPRQLVPGGKTKTTCFTGDNKPEDGDVMLDYAASQGLVEVVESILAEGNIPCDLLDHYGRTALHWAAERGHLLVTRVLLHAGANIENRSPQNATPIMLAALHGHEEVVSVLLEAGAGKSDRRNMSSEGDPWRSTALHCAAAGGHLGVVSRLLDAGFDKEQRDGAGLTPAELSARAAHASSPRVTRCLLPPDMGARMVHDYVNMVMEDIATVAGLAKSGAHLDWQDGIGNSPLHRAAHFRHVSITNILLQYGAEPDLRNHRGGSPLHIAACQGSVSIAAALLEAGASIEGRMVNGRSPLHLAVINNNIDVVRLLLQEGAFTEHRDRSRGQTPLSEAAEYGLAPIIRILIDAGANVESTSSAGLTPLHWACRFNHPKSVEVLLASGANPDAVDEAVLKAARMMRTQGGKGMGSLQPTASDVVGLGDPHRWNVVMRCPFLGELARVTRQRLDPTSTSQIMSALERARRDRTWCRRGWLLILASRRGVLRKAGEVKRSKSRVTKTESRVSGCGFTSNDSMKASCPASWDGEMKVFNDWNVRDIFWKKSRGVVENWKAVDSSQAKIKDGFHHWSLNRLSIRNAWRERELESDTRNDSGGTSHVLRPGTIEALLIIASVEFGVFRNVVSYI